MSHFCFKSISWDNNLTILKVNKLGYSFLYLQCLKVQSSLLLLNPLLSSRKGANYYNPCQHETWDKMSSQTFRLSITDSKIQLKQSVTYLVWVHSSVVKPIRETVSASQWAIIWYLNVSSYSNVSFQVSYLKPLVLFLLSLLIFSNQNLHIFQFVSSNKDTCY